MTKKGWWNKQEENDYAKSIRKQVLSQIAVSEKKPKADWRELFRDVYSEMPQHLMYDHLKYQTFKFYYF